MAKPTQQIVTKRYNNYIVYDWETSGFDTQKNAVTEFAAIVLDGKSLTEIIRYDNLIKPYGDRIYDSGAAAVTGITKEMCEEGGITLKELAEDLKTLFKEAGGGGNVKGAGYWPILVAHNAQFDNGWMQSIAEETGLKLGDWLFGKKDHYGNYTPYCIDTVMECKMAFRTHSPGPENYKLGTICQYAGVELVEAHRAMNDVEGLANLFVQLLTQFAGGKASNTTSTVSGKARETFSM